MRPVHAEDELVDRDGGRHAHREEDHVGSVSPGDQSETVAAAQVVEPCRGQLVFLLPEACEDPLRKGVCVDIGTVLIVAEALEKVPARAVEGDPRVVDEVRVDAEARTASAALALHDVRTDCLVVNRVVAELRRLVSREHGQRGDRKRRYLALEAPIRLPEEEGPVMSVRCLHGVPGGHASRSLNPNKMLFSHGSSCELKVPSSFKNKKENVEMHHSFNPKWQRVYIHQCQRSADI